MPIIINTGSLNNLTVDDVYIFQQSPQATASAGVPSNQGAIVGTASWGPIGIPTPFSNTSSLYSAFGRSLAGANNLVTEGYFACYSSNNFLGIRVVDGSQQFSTVTLTNAASANAITISGKYTGVEGNYISVLLSTGSNSTAAAPTMTATVQRAGYPTELYPNLPNTGGTFWTNLANALNNGLSGVRPPSNYVTASTISTTASAVPSSGAIFLSGGANGDASITTAMLLGVAGTANPGMQNIPASVFQFILAGCTDPTAFSSMASYAQSIGALAIAAFPTGTSPAAAVASKQANNGASVNLALVKDFIYFFDPSINQQRLVSPLGEVLGLICSLPPWQSPGNQPENGFSNLISTDQNGVSYSFANLSLLEQNGILTITNPIPRGNVYGLPHGNNSSGISGETGINYTRMTNFLSSSLEILLGQFVGQGQTNNTNDPVRAAARGVINGFMQNLLSQNAISAYSLILDTTNNTPTTVAQGYMLATLQVQYLAAVQYFVVTLQGGQGVTVATSVAS
jgi:hypothetical protein